MTYKTNKFWQILAKPEEPGKPGKKRTFLGKNVAKPGKKKDATGQKKQPKETDTCETVQNRKIHGILDRHPLIANGRGSAKKNGLQRYPP